MPIRRSPNGVRHVRPQPGRDRPESVVAINRNARSQSVGTGGRNHPVRSDIAKVQFGWPVGLPLCRPLSGGLWEVRSPLPSKRQARVFFGFHDGMLIALHAFIKKTQKTAPDDLALARQRLKEVLS